MAERTNTRPPIQISCSKACYVKLWVSKRVLLIIITLPLRHRSNMKSHELCSHLNSLSGGPTRWRRLSWNSLQGNWNLTVKRDLAYHVASAVRTGKIVLCFGNSNGQIERLNRRREFFLYCTFQKELAIRLLPSSSLPWISMIYLNPKSITRFTSHDCFGAFLGPYCLWGYYRIMNKSIRNRFLDLYGH